MKTTVTVLQATLCSLKLSFHRQYNTQGFRNPLGFDKQHEEAQERCSYGGVKLCKILKIS